MAVSFLNQSELIPGYVTVDRIGAGGYGEVWRVKAPGGLDKAIKVIYGYVKEERAARELKALNRIKEIRHPFLLSLERIEVVANQLLVVTELADQSLMERFQECREKGGSDGIPRDELIEHIQDAAAALDYMLEKKGLQHLDIKPENLLLIGDRIKVADFGLVKDVSDQVNTLMGGLTPVYASPEVFGGSASRQSDQYSLAIVFQQMLTGVLPFPGRTQQQLAIQHKQADPRLSPLPESDRPIVARALSKTPTDRFPSCQAFINAILNKDRVVVAAPDPDATTPEDEQKRASDRQTTSQDKSETLVARGAESPVADEDEPVCTETLKKVDGSKVARFPTLPPSGGNAVQVTSGIRHLDAVDIDASQPEVRPALFIGIGGTGARVLQALKRHLETWDGFTRSDAIQLLYLDTDAETIKEARAGAHGTRLAHEEIIYANLRRPRDYQERSADFLRWISRRWLYNIPRSLKTQGYRPLGRLAWVDHAEKVHVTVRKHIKQLIQDESIHALEDACGVLCNRSPRIVLVGSTSGGTAGGMMFDMIHTVQVILGEMELSDEGLCTVLTHSTNGNPRESTLAAANTYSFLSELQHLAKLPKANAPVARPNDPRHVAPLSPVPTSYFMNLGENLSEEVFQKRIKAIADYLYCNTATSAGLLLDRCRALTPAEKDGDVQLRSFGVSTLEVVKKERPNLWMRFMSQHVAKHWLESVVVLVDPLPQDQDVVEANGPQADSESEQKPKGHRPAEQPAVKSKLEAIIERELDDWTGSRFVEQLKQRLFAGHVHRDDDPSAQNDDFLSQMALKLNDAAKQLHQLVGALDLPRFSALHSIELPRLVEDRGEYQGLDDQMWATIPKLAPDLGDRILSRFLESLADESTDQGSNDASSLAALLQKAVQPMIVKTVNRLAAGHTMDDEGVLCPTAERIQECYDASTVRLSGCGFSQRSFIVARQMVPWLETNPAVRELPLVTGSIDTPVICREAEQLSLAQLAHHLTEGRPEIIEAADRLHIRADVRWSRPPAICHAEDERSETLSSQAESGVG